MFTYQRQSTSWNSVPTWLLTPGTVLMKCHARNSKCEPLVEEVELIESNLWYPYVRHADGRESTVSLGHLAPRGKSIVEQSHVSPVDTTEDRKLVKEHVNHHMVPEVPPPELEYCNKEPF